MEDRSAPASLPHAVPATDPRIAVVPRGLNEYGTLRRVLVRGPRAVFRDRAQVRRQWQALGYTAPPDVERAEEEFARLVEVLRGAGATVDLLGGDPTLGLDAIYVRDSAILAPGGMILGRMGKAARAAEPAAARRAFEHLGIAVQGAIEAPGCLEGGDVVWLDERTVAVGQGYRTNAAGIEQLRALLGPQVTVQPVPLPHWRGPDDVFHLMSMLSPLDRDLALVYSPLLPVPFRQWLQERDISLLEVPVREFDSMGCNVLALGPRRCVLLEGNLETHATLVRAGVEATLIAGAEISVKGAGGPTCLTRPVVRG